MHKELLSISGLWNVSRPFVANLAHLAAPRNKRSRKDEPNTIGFLDEKKRAAVLTLTDVLISQSVMTLPRNIGRYTLDTDACDKGISLFTFPKAGRQNVMPSQLLG